MTAPTVSATVIGVEPRHVRVIERRHPQGTSPPVVLVELGGTECGMVTIPGDLAILQQVIAEVARGLVDLGRARGLEDG